MKRKSATEVLNLLSGDFVFWGNASVRFGVGDAPRSVKKDLQAIALSQEHRLTHLLRNPWCRDCQRAERATQPAGNATKAVSAEIRVFGDLVAEDHLGEQEQCRCRYRYESFGMVIFGHAMTRVEHHLACEKSAVGAALALDKFLGRHIRSGCVRDHAPEFDTDMHVGRHKAVISLGGRAM